jgi:hypothetical protein
MHAGIEIQGMSDVKEEDKEKDNKKRKKCNLRLRE